MKNDHDFMHRCIQLAKKAYGHVSPNPMVGSVIVYKGRIISEGYHKFYGKEHAEVNAINNVKNKDLLRYSTLYVNLEPCSHFGNTGPCSDFIIQHNINRVVVGCIDTSSKVSGKGIAKMRENGVRVDVGLLDKECQFLNRRFLNFHKNKRPYIILKWAESQDGFIAPINQTKPFWMTSEKSKKLVHKWRSEEDAILVGRITAEKDNPSLTVREVSGRNPIRLVIDKDLKLSKHLNLFNSESKTILFNEIKSDNFSKNNYIKINFNNMINNILKELYKQDIQSVIIEGGTTTLQSFIKENIWDEARIFTTDTKLENGVKSPIIKGRKLSETQINTDLLKIILND